MTTRDYPSEICWDCGRKYGRIINGHCATFYEGTCGWCGEKAIVTEPRDYGYPPAPEQTMKRDGRVGTGSGGILSPPTS